MLRRHNQIAFPGTLHFVTTVTAIRGNWFTSDDICRQVLWEFEKSRARHDLQCLGYVLMPDHLHALLVQPTEDAVISDMMREFKRRTAYYAKMALNTAGPLWRRRYDDVPIPNRDAAVTRLRYMHANPVRSDVAQAPEGYPWSSARDYAGAGNGCVTLARELL